MAVEYKEFNGEIVFLVDAKFLKDKELVDVKFGLRTAELKRRAKFGLFSEIAQFYTLVNDGLILTKHAFCGLERPLYCHDSCDGDQEKLVYSRKPMIDYEWVGGRDGRPVRKNAPKGHVFVVIVSPNRKHKELYPEVECWIEHWAWIEEDQGLSQAPVNWVDRFKSKLWTQEQE